jgi:hypothetical protein
MQKKRKKASIAVIVLLIMFLIFLLISSQNSTIMETHSNPIPPPDKKQVTCLDFDNDGYKPLFCGGKDCNDYNPNINPSQKEICNDGFDNDCDGTDNTCKENFIQIQKSNSFNKEPNLQPNPPLHDLRTYSFYIHNWHFRFEAIIPIGTTAQLNIRLRNESTGEEHLRQYTLFDDGLHTDGEANDGEASNYILIENTFPEGKNTLYYTIDRADGAHRSGSRSLFIVAQQKTEECNEFTTGTNDPNDPTRMNIIVAGVNLGDNSGEDFVPDWATLFFKVNEGLNWDENAHPQGYYKLNEFTNDIQSFFNMQPLKDYKNKFNVWYINPMYNGPKTVTNNNDVTFFLQYILKRCPFQNSFVVAYDPEVKRSSAGGLIRMRPFDTRTLVLPHELGHQIGPLHDEYADFSVGCKPENRVPSSNEFGGAIGNNVYHASTNTNNQISCQQYSSWNYLVNNCYVNDILHFGNCPTDDELIQCIHGAFYCNAGIDKYYWRPAKNTLMGSSSTTSIFSFVDMGAICRSLESHTGIRLGICNDICTDKCPNGWVCSENPNNLGSGICVSDNCPQGDTDVDAICDIFDNCINIPNFNQDDLDNDNIGDACDIDADGDQFTSNLDCDDFNPNINPNAIEICTNTIDENCDPSDDICENCIDNDGDGYGDNCPLGPENCDDNVEENPGLFEICGDNLDNNCDGINGNARRSCGLNSVGICSRGFEYCINDKWTGICEGEITYQIESCTDGASNCLICNDGLDNNCDNLVDNCGCGIQNVDWSKTIVQEGTPMTLQFNAIGDCQPSFTRFIVEVYKSSEQPSLSPYPIDRSIFDQVTELPSFTILPAFESPPIWDSPYFELECDAQGTCKSAQYYYTVRRFNDNKILQSSDLTVLSFCDEDGDLFVKQTCIPPILNYNRNIFDCDDSDSLITTTCAPPPCNDIDGDGYIAENTPIGTCGNICGPSKTLACFGNNDCNDNDPSLSLSSPEICDGLDNDCDGRPNYFDACAYIHEIEAE